MNSRIEGKKGSYGGLKMGLQSTGESPVWWSPELDSAVLATYTLNDIVTGFYSRYDCWLSCFHLDTTPPEIGLCTLVRVPTHL